MLNIDELRQVGVNVETGIENFSNDIELYEKGLRTVIHSTHLKDIRLRINNNDFIQAYLFSQDLKKLVDLICINRVSTALKDILASLHAGTAERVVLNLSYIEYCFNKIKAILENNDK